MKGGLRGDPPSYRHPPYQGGQGGSEAKSIFNLIITTYLSILAFMVFLYKVESRLAYSSYLNGEVRSFPFG
ncbi:MAG: hypothetical protein EWV61_10565 [Microcystis aeruginosa Ma_AC_P_19900807_S300]|nr:MAG: hypothetical protein EWV61_10565 [Microcystis aeruginosa Ma_AC_P_19900807_S300]